MDCWGYYAMTRQRKADPPPQPMSRHARALALVRQRKEILRQMEAAERRWLSAQSWGAARLLEIERRMQELE